MLDYLTENLKQAITHLNLKLLFEIRLRVNKPVTINYGGKYVFLGENGVCKKQSALRVNFSDIENILFTACEFSLYSVTDQIKQGFITSKSGERIGICGSYVYENCEPFTIKEVTSLNIRIPHEVENCSKIIYDNCLNEKLNNILILSVAGGGKTTMLRDLSKKICDNYFVNVLVDDERNELSATNKDYSLNVGDTADVVRFADKKTAFTASIRAMRPDVIITDELINDEEVKALCEMALCGVKIMASSHINSIENLKEFSSYKWAIENKIFTRYVVLDDKKIGVVKFIFDQDLNLIYGLN